MAEVLQERICNGLGIHWIRTHATNSDGVALCSPHISTEKDNCVLMTGTVTCPECIEIIQRCWALSASEVNSEDDNELLHRRFR